MRRRNPNREATKPANTYCCNGDISNVVLQRRLFQRFVLVFGLRTCLPARFPSLKEAVAVKPRKKNKGTKLSLSEFTTGAHVGPGFGRSGRDSIIEAKGLTADEILRLPTGPRERTAEEIEQGRHGGGFRNYGSYGGGGGRRDEGEGRRGYGSGFGEEGMRSGYEQVSSRADDADNWGAGKKSFGGDMPRRDRYENLGNGGGGVAMALKSISAAALFVLATLLLFSLTMASCPPKYKKPKKYTPPIIPSVPTTPKYCPPTTPIYPPVRKCPIDALKLNVCANVLNGLVSAVVGIEGSSEPCCSLIKGLVDLDAAICLCTAIKANVLGINLNIPVSLSLLVNQCGRVVPSHFQCP